MQTVFNGMVSPGFQFASGEAAKRGDPSCPFPAGTLKLQAPYLLERDRDLSALVPGLYWGTINLQLDRKLVLGRPDFSETLDWTQNLEEDKRIPPETFSFVRCCFVYTAPDDPTMSLYYPGLLYYPHPETKPGTNRHHYDVLEILTSEVPNLRYGTPASVICRADAFRPF